MREIILLTMFIVAGVFSAGAQNQFEEDIHVTSAGNIKITFIGHATLMFDFEGKIIHVDPWSSLDDYSKLPKADLILVTHEHGDHFDMKAISQILTEETVLVYNEQLKDTPGGIVIKNGDSQVFAGLTVTAVPAYNIVNNRSEDNPFHPKGIGNGYIITFGDTKVYIAGDTENTPEMKQLKNIDIAFLPMNLPYTMTPEMVADAVRAFKPRIVYPYHYGDTDTSILTELLKDLKDVEIRIRKM